MRHGEQLNILPAVQPIEDFRGNHHHVVLGAYFRQQQGELVTTEFYGIALPKGSENVAVVNDAIMTMMEDGTYAEIYQTWFGAEPPELPEEATTP